MWQNVAADIVIWLIQSVNVVGFCYFKNGCDSVGGGDGREGDGGDGGNGGLTVKLLHYYYYINDDCTEYGC